MKKALLAAAAIPIPGQVSVPAAWDGYAPNSIVFFTKLVFGGILTTLHRSVTLFVVGKFIAHDSEGCPVWELESQACGPASTRLLACRGQPQVRFQGEADMNRQARPAGSVENDKTNICIRGRSLQMRANKSQ